MPKSSQMTSTASSTTTAMSSFTLRIHDVVRPFSGEGDVVQWLDPVKKSRDNVITKLTSNNATICPGGYREKKATIISLRI